MPIPVLFIGFAAATGVFGAAKTATAIAENNKANKINLSANKSVEDAQFKLEQNRQFVSTALSQLGELKINMLTNNITDFVNLFSKIKNVDFRSSVGLEELSKLHIDEQDFEELKELGNFALQITGGAFAGVTGGALTAFGAYGAAQTLAFASTGTAISTLSGAAATNATLAFFGGGSLAAGGLGMAGGVMVLGGLVAGPALLVMGLITEAKTQEKLDKALANKAQADEIVEALNTASFQCASIRRRTYMFYNLLAHLDAYFLPLLWKMEKIIEKEGCDYSTYSLESKKVIMSAASAVGSIKAILDTPILTSDGLLTEESDKITDEISKLIYEK